MKERLTKQGVRDLGGNGRRREAAACRHNPGPEGVVGRYWAFDPSSWQSYERPIYGRCCTWCGRIMEQRQ